MNAGGMRGGETAMSAMAAGTAYDPKDKLVLLEDTTLYAQWQKTDDPDPIDPTDPTTPTDPTNPADPTDPGDPHKNKNPGTPDRSSSTGDKTPLALLLLLMIGSAGFVLVPRRGH